MSIDNLNSISHNPNQPNPNSQSLQQRNETKSFNIKEHYLLSDFDIQKTIGEGTFGKVKLALHIPTQEYVAIKILEKKQIEDDEELLRITREIKYLKYLNHRNVIQIYQILESETTFYIIMEYASKGELFAYITFKRQLNEREASFFYAQIITGIEYIHINRIAHRDLKPENILMTDEGLLKIIDFGLSNKYQIGQLLSTACGSPCYASPEMILGQKYKGVLSDIWSSGVILFAIVCGYFPFEDDNNDIIYQKVLRGIGELPHHLSPGCKDLISKLLTVNPKKRIDIDEIKAHSFLQEGFERYNNMIKLEDNEKDINGLRLNIKVIDKMMLLPSFLLNNNGNRQQIEEGYTNKAIGDCIDKNSLIREISKSKYTSLSLTYKLLCNKLNRKSKECVKEGDDDNVIDNKNNIIESLSSSETTSLNTPLENCNRGVELNAALIHKEQDKVDKDITPKQSETILLEEHHDINERTNTNEDIQDTITRQVIAHSFKNSFNASKKPNQEGIMTNTNIDKDITINSDNTSDHNNNHNHIQSIQVLNSLSNTLEYSNSQNPIVTSLEVSSIVMKNQIDSNVILVKSALNPLYKSKNKNKFKRNNIMNNYLQSASLTNRIANINHLIDTSTSIPDELKKKPKKNEKRILKSSFIPLNTINLDEPITICNTISIIPKTAHSSKSIPTGDYYTKENHKRANSVRIDKHLICNNTVNANSNLNYNEAIIDLRGKSKSNIVSSPTRNGLRNSKDKEKTLIQKYHPSLTNRVQYERKKPIKYVRCSLKDSDVTSSNLLKEKKAKAVVELKKKNNIQLSIETQQNYYHSKDKGDTNEKQYQVNEALANHITNSNMKICANNDKSYRNTTHRNNFNKSPLEDKLKTMSPIKLTSSKQLLTSNYIDHNVNKSNKSNSKSKGYCSKPNISSTTSTTITTAATTKSLILSPKPHKTMKIMPNTTTISNQSNQPLIEHNRMQLKRENQTKTIKSIQLRLKNLINDFAVCSTKLSLIKIIERLNLLCKQNSYFIKEIDSKHFSCSKGIGNEVVIEICKINSQSAIKLYNCKENAKDGRKI